MDTDPFLYVHDLAVLLNRKVSTVRSDVTRRPHTLPPITRLPGSNRVRWHRQVVDEWIEKHMPKTTSE